MCFPFSNVLYSNNKMWSSHWPIWDSKDFQILHASSCHIFCLKMNRAGSAFLSFLPPSLFLPSVETFKKEPSIDFVSPSVSSRPAPSVFSASHKTQGGKSKAHLGSAVKEMILLTWKKKCSDLAWLSSVVKDCKRQRSIKHVSWPQSP